MRVLATKSLGRKSYLKYIFSVLLISYLLFGKLLSGVWFRISDAHFTESELTYITILVGV